MKNKHKIHPRILDLKSDLEQGRLTRRQFLRYAALLGLSSAVSTSLVQMIAQPEAAAVEYGGKIKISGILTQIMHPAKAKWIAPSQIFRQIAEYLTFTDADNITRPHLLQDWEAAPDLRTWTLNLREGVFFNNAKEMTADDLVFTIGQWLDKTVGSPMAGIVGAYLDPTGVEKVNRYQVKLHLNRPEIALPEHLFYYPAVILNHRTFEGDFLKAPHGTGPYILDSYAEGEHCVLKKRMNYWQPGLPFLSEIKFIDLGFDPARRIGALLSGDVDVADLNGLDELDAVQRLKGNRGLNIEPVASARANVLRMRVDREPWSDNRVRTALKLCQHRQKIMLLAGMKQGTIGQDCHISPSHPEYCPKPALKYDPRQARTLLKEAGFAEGLDVTLTIGDQWPDIEKYARVLQNDAAQTGFRIHIDKIPALKYKQSVTEIEFGITPWTHRPLGTMVLNLAYTGDMDGKPVPMNETRWVDEEFSALLAAANATLDLSERRNLFCRLENIQMKRGSIGIAWWQNRWTATRKTVRDLKPHPSGYLLLDRVWMRKLA